MLKNTLKIVLFSATLLGILFLLTKLFTPTWITWNNDNTMKEFYEEPKNSIQVLFLGTSQVASGIAPIDLYDNYGICAYNMGTERQPLLSSYYWLQEVYRLHKDSLKVIVLDTSYFVAREREHDSLRFFNEKAIAHMRFSPVKEAAVRELSERYEDLNYLENIIPLFRYHSRWSELNRDDFKAFTNQENFLYTRGQHIAYNQASSALEAKDILLPHWDLTEEYEKLETDPNAFIKETGEDNRDIINRIYQFCSEHNLELVLMKLPKYWPDIRHDISNQIAKELDVPFIDFNEVDIAEDINLYFPFDYMEALHPNFRGARKFTDYLGRFLKENYTLDDVREDASYDYIKEQSEQYDYMREDSKITTISELSSYLEAIDDDRFTILLSVAGDAASGFPDEIKDQMKKMGFNVFPTLRHEQAYVGIRAEGKVILEEKSSSKKGRILVDGRVEEGHFYVSDVYNETLDEDDYVIGTPEGKDPTLLTGAGYFSIKSESRTAGGTVSTVINNKEYSDNRHGLNIVVYDNITRFEIDSATFDLRYIAERRSDLDPIDEYNERYEKARLKGEEFRAAREAEKAAEEAAAESAEQPDQQ
ncbi:MAG: hypothetical protein J6D14_00575 [Lachnospiraceae bacterium]|nr:hypothetical protein [Lachnospiraceae bacterium]